MSKEITTITLTVRVAIDASEHYRLYDRLLNKLEQGALFEFVEHRNVRPIDGGVRVQTGHLLTTSSVRSPSLRKAIRDLQAFAPKKKRKP